MNPNEKAARKKGLKHLIKNMSQLEVAGHGSTPMSGKDVHSAIGDAAAAGADPDAAEDAAEGAEGLQDMDGDAADEAAHEGEGDEATGKEPELADEVKNFMKRPLHGTRPDEKGSRVVVRMISSTPDDRAPKAPKGVQPKPPKYGGRR